MRTTTTLVICLVVVVAAGICNDDDDNDDDSNERSRNESSVDGSTSLLYNLSTKQRRHVKKELLHLLGLDHTPKPSTRRQRLEGSRASAPTYMLSLYETIQRHDDDDDDDGLVPIVDRAGRSDDSVSMSRLVNKQLGSADTVMSFVNQALSDHENRMNSFAIDCRFDLSSQVSSTDVLTGAFLRIYKLPKVKGLTEKLRIEIHRPRTGNDSLLTRESKQQTLEQRVTLLSSRSGWIDVNLTRMTSAWMTSPKRNDGLRIYVFNHRGELVEPSTVGFVGSNGRHDKQVFLVAFFKNNPDQTTTTTTTKASTATRLKRSADNGNKNRRTTRQQDSSPQNDDPQIWSRPYKQDRKCQVRTLKVSFKDLKWQDWIIAPEGYAAYYCDGDCVSPLHANNATNHAIVQTMAYMMNPASVPKPCCAPTKLSALSVLYFDDNSNVILKKYRNMVVRACGCH